MPENYFLFLFSSLQIYASFQNQTPHLFQFRSWLANAGANSHLNRPTVQNGHGTWAVKLYFSKEAYGNTKLVFNIRISWNQPPHGFFNWSFLLVFAWAGRTSWECTKWTAGVDQPCQSIRDNGLPIEDLRLRIQPYWPRLCDMEVWSLINYQQLGRVSYLSWLGQLDLIKSYLSPWAQHRLQRTN